MRVYAVLNQAGIGKFLDNELLRRGDWGGNIQTKIITKFPFTFEGKPVFHGKTKQIIFIKIMGNAFILSENDIDWYEESRLPQLIQYSFELLANEFKYRSSHEWRKHSESLFNLFLELNTKEDANDFPLTKALLLDYEAINYSVFATPIFRMQTAREAMKSLRN